MKDPLYEKKQNRESVPGSRVVVLGAGRSGRSVSRLLIENGAIVILSDNSSSEEMKTECKALDLDNFSYELGGHSDDLLDNCDIVVVSPGISLKTSVIKEARAQNIKVFGEIEVAYWFCENKIIAVTGTNGKSTTVSMLGSIFEAGKRPAVVAGNIGLPFSEVVGYLKKDEFVILEVSSYQLETTETFRPWIAAILNIQPDHLKRHGTMAEYVECKFKITSNQIRDDVLFLNAADKFLNPYSVKPAAAMYWFNAQEMVEHGATIVANKMMLIDYDDNREILDCDILPLKGEHNRENALLSVAIAHFVGISNESIIDGLVSFNGLPHRMETAGEINGRTFVNDSKATNLDSLTVALKTYDQKVTLIAGGEDKGNDFSIINDLISGKVKSLILIGEATKRMSESWASIVEKTVTADSLESAIEKSLELAQPGEIVLFSPACASFDMFNSFEHRGDVFKKIISTMAQ